LGVVLRVLELLWITGRYHTSPSEIDYLLGTLPFSVGIFTLLLTAQRLGEINWLVGLSRYSAGAYCAHMLVVELFGSGPRRREIRCGKLLGHLWRLR
jgi:surface polysaccharide O-acyltransferase-like enzyme